MRCTLGHSPPPVLGRPPRNSSGELRRLGVTVLEIMPIAEFPGRFGWGYDGVDLFAPYMLRHS